MVQVMTLMKKTSFRRGEILILAIAVASFLMVPEVAGQPPAGLGQPAQRVESKEVEGEVVLLTPDMITVEFIRTQTGSTEIVIPLGDGIQFTHLQNLQDIQQGDRVRVTFTETYQELASGKRSNFKRAATGISLIKRATTGLTSGGP